MASKPFALTRSSRVSRAARKTCNSARGTGMWTQTSLAGKRVLVTAGGDGIGLEIARAFTVAGAKVLICDIQPECIARLAKTCPEIHSCIADVSREADVAAMFDLVDRKLGGLD